VVFHSETQEIEQMKAKYLLLSQLALAAICAPAAGAVMCMDTTIGQNARCTMVSNDRTADFSTTCGNMSVRILGYCSPQEATTPGTKSTTLKAGVGPYCWCKLISPAVSQWVYLENTKGLPLPANANETCAATCPIDCLSSIASENRAPDVAFELFTAFMN